MDMKRGSVMFVFLQNSYIETLISSVLGSGGLWEVSHEVGTLIMVLGPYKSGDKRACF